MNFKKIDDYICGVFQSFTEFLDSRLGISCFLCARLCMVLGLFFGLLSHKHYINLPAFLIFFGSILVCVMFVFGIYRIHVIEKRSENLYGYVNPERVRGMGARIVALYLTFVFSVFYFWTGKDFYLYFSFFFLVLGAYSYFLSCTRVPPGLVFSQLRMQTA